MKKTFSEVIDGLNDKLNKGAVSGNLSSDLEDTIYLMSRDIKRASEQDGYSVSEERVNMVRTMLTKVLNEMVLGDISNVIDIIEEFSLLCHNWNKIAQDKNIKRLISSINVILDLQNNMGKVASVLADLYNEVEATRHFAPPSYDIKKEFLASLSDKFEEGV